jgi:hypothetical protein
MRIRRPTAMHAVLLAGALLMVACGSSATSARRPQPSSTTVPMPLATSVSQILSACDLVTPVDITAALGELPHIPATIQTSDHCTYASASEGNFVGLLIERNTTKSGFKEAAAKGSATRPVPDLGDAAFQSSNGRSVFVLTGDEYLHIAVNGSSVKPAGVRSLARTALQRLQR